MRYQSEKLRSLEDKKEDLEFLKGVLRDINSKEDPDKILHRIMVRIADLINAEAWSLLLVDEKRRELYFKEAFGPKGEEVKGLRIRLDQGVAGWVVMHNKPVIIPDVRKDKRFFSGVDEKTKFTTRSILAVPVVSKEKVIGVVEVLNKKDPEGFTPEDLERIKSYIDQVAIILENIHLVSSLERKIKNLSLLFEVGRKISSRLLPHQVLRESARLIRKAFNYHYCVIALEENGRLVLKAFSGEKGIRPKRKEIILGKGISGWVAKHKKELIVNDVEGEERYLPGIKGIKSEMAIPIMRKNKLIGVIDVGSKEKFAFDEEDAELLSQIASQLGVALENAYLYEKVSVSAITDDLTGLYNARYAYLYLDEIIKKADETGKPVSLIFLDLDHFKWVNDTYGHLIGGEMLRRVAQRIKNKVGKKGSAIRYGGDEYIIILPDTSLLEGAKFAEELRKEIGEKPFELGNGIRYHITASFGVSEYPGVAEDEVSLIRTADQAMYWVKEHGRNKTCYKTPDGEFVEYRLEE